MCPDPKPAQQTSPVACAMCLKGVWLRLSLEAQGMSLEAKDDIAKIKAKEAYFAEEVFKGSCALEKLDKIYSRDLGIEDVIKKAPKEGEYILNKLMRSTEEIDLRLVVKEMRDSCPGGQPKHRDCHMCDPIGINPPCTTCECKKPWMSEIIGNCKDSNVTSYTGTCSWAKNGMKHPLRSCSEQEGWLGNYLRLGEKRGSDLDCATCVRSTIQSNNIQPFAAFLEGDRRLAEVTPVHHWEDEAPLTVCDAVLGVVVILLLLVAWRFYSAFHEAQVRPYRCRESKCLRRRSDTMMKIGV